MSLDKEKKINLIDQFIYYNICFWGKHIYIFYFNLSVKESFAHALVKLFELIMIFDFAIMKTSVLRSTANPSFCFWFLLHISLIQYLSLIQEYLEQLTSAFINM